MNWIESIILGVLQGLSEFLPVSSSGHLEIGKVLLGVNTEESLLFTVVVHGATVLSTIFIFWKEIVQIVKGFFEFRWNFETQYVVKIGISMIPVLIIGLFFEEQVEALFTGNLILVGLMLWVTALLLGFTYYAKSGKREVSFVDAFIMGIAQSIAVIPGISRSGSTIATGLLLGNKRPEVSKFSFLMVLAPIIGANILSIKDADFSSTESVGLGVLAAGFFAAFVTGLLACKLMIKIVNQGKLIWFAVYCAVVGSIAVLSMVL